VKTAARAAAPLLTAPVVRERDSLYFVLAQLDTALDRAAKAPLGASYRALANSIALRSLGLVQVRVDTLELLERVRRALDPAAAPQREFAQLSERTNAIGAALQGIGQARRTVLIQRIETLERNESDADTGMPPGESVRAREARDSTGRLLARAEVRLREARQWHERMQMQADSAARARAARILGASPFAAATSALAILAALGFALAVVAEARDPTIAHAREAERVTGLPVLASATASHATKEGRARLQPGTGVDPFRMVYLSLTAAGMRERVVCVTGDDPRLTAAAAGQLAVSAAAEERATLVVDIAPGTDSTSAYFGWTEEPGFSEAIAGVRLWREVARSIGASDGLDIDVIPPGRLRDDTTASVQSESACSEFSAFLAEYDFVVLATPTRTATGIAAALCGRPKTIVVARTAQTKVEVLQRITTELKADDIDVSGILLIHIK
jgi:Mrp family chromosome partitioning ATPase